MTTDSFKERFLPLNTMLYSVAFRLLGDRYEAEDAVQCLYMKLWERKDEIKDCGRDAAFALKILRNICCDRWRAMQIRGSIESEPPEYILDDTQYDRLEYGDAKKCVDNFLEQQPPAHATIMRMRMRGCTMDEIEAVTQLSQMNIRTILSRMRKKFREYYNSKMI